MYHTVKMLDQNPRWDAKMTQILLIINMNIMYGGTYRIPSSTYSHSGDIQPNISQEIAALPFCHLCSSE